MENMFFEHHNNEPEQTVTSTRSGINPKNPFNNFTENEDYNCDYRDIEPEIDIPSCVLPYEPSRLEKQRIRRYCNLTGGILLLHLIMSNTLILGLLTLVQHIVMKLEGIDYSEATYQYIAGLETFMSESSISIGLNMLVLLLCSTLAFVIGSSLTRVKISSYFENSSGITFGKMVVYCLITFFIRYVGGFAGAVFEIIFNGVDMSVGTEMTSYQNTRTIIVTAVYACIVAPVIEELLCRGFVLKNLSRVSQRFGIMVSALFFGLMHGNVNQFIFGFIFGIFLAQIDIKHNSLLPSIIVHSFANTFSIVLSYSGVLDNQFSAMITGLAMFLLAIIGTVFFLKFRKNNRLPNTMPHQAVRNGTAVSSVFLVLVIAAYTATTIINSFPSIMDSIMTKL